MIESTLQTGDVTIHVTGPDHAVDQVNKIVGDFYELRDRTVEDSRSLRVLQAEFQAKIVDVLAACAARGYSMRPFYTVRTPRTQARLWRQSRPTAEIHKMIRKLQHEGAPFLAHVLEAVGPQNGRWTTNALPGQSWHQWGRAVDCFAVSNEGRAIWSSGFEAYKIYAIEAHKRGLTAGYYWRRKDAVHVQESSEQVRARYTWREIDAEMQRRFPYE